MSTEITMPKLSDTMTEGRLISWKKSVGDHVDRGEIIAEVETDKATMELEAYASGTLLEIRIKAGEMAPVGTVIGMIGAAEDQGKSSSAALPAAPSEPSPLPFEPGDVPERVMEVPGPEGQPVPPAVSGAGDEKASPLVRRLAREKGIDLREVTGSGPEGRVLQEDLEKTGIGDRDPYYGPKGLGTGEDQKPALDTETAVVGGATVQPLSRMRAAIARTVSEAWRTIPHFAVTVEVDMGEAERVRHELKNSGTPVSLNDFIIKAAAAAIGKFPLVNASFGADGITVHADINIGIAVALDDGLLVPVVKGCQGLTLKEIAANSRDLIARAKAGKVNESEITGGTFSISNLGMFGVDEFTAVILPAQGAILAVGAVGDRPVIKSGHLAAGRMMRMTLSADHRLIDGAYAARFLREVKRILENPVTMLV